MRVQIVATGEIEHAPASPFLTLLEKAGIVKYLADPTPRKPETNKFTWSLVRTRGTPDVAGELHVLARCSCGEFVALFPPIAADSRGRCSCGHTEPVPADLLAKGREEWERVAKAQHIQHLNNLKTLNQSQYRPQRETR